MDTVIRNARVMTCDPARPGLGMIEHGAIAFDSVNTGDVEVMGRIKWVGGDGDRPHGDREIDARGRLLTPGLVDCHTHAIFAGDRASEFAMRAAGKAYVEIQASGGGIMATLAPTRAAGDELESILVTRLKAMFASGSTTAEVKTGYDLTTKGELALLELIWSAAFGLRIEVVSTLLAHLVPPERTKDRDKFVREICDQWIPNAKKKARSFDVWCESNAFTTAETRQMFEAAKRHGLAVRAHVGQLSDIGGAELCAEFGALSADHLEYVSDAGIAALAKAGTVAVMLPGACVQMRLPVPPVEKFRRAGVPMAVATDLNPGSSYCETLPIQMWLATTHFGMTVEEAWLGVTRHAARALAVEAGAIVPGARAALVLWNCEQPAEVPYRYGTNLVAEVIA